MANSDTAAVVRNERRGDVVWVTIDRPERSNALTGAVLDGLARAIEGAGADPTVRAVVLTGAGDRAFCSGADLRDVAFAPAERPAASYADVLRAMLDCPVPIVARINGACVAGGMGLLAASDLAIASDAARFALPEVRVGLFPMQVLSVIRRLIGERRLVEMCLTGEALDASAAREAGLVGDVVPAAQLDERIESLLARLRTGSPQAQRHGKAAMRAIAGQTAHEALPYLEAALADLARAGDVVEGRAAFVERRPPRWANE